MMTSVYNDADYLAVYKQRKRVLSVFFGVTAAYVLFCVAWLLYYISLPYKDPMQTLPKACVYVASALYVVLIFPYMAIKFSRVNRYYKILGYLSEGLKAEEKNYFYCFEEKTLQKDNVDVNSCIFETWNKKKSEWMEREAYFDAEKPLPEFDSGDQVHYIVQSNFIIQYEIVQKKALEFEEVDEDEYFETDAQTGVAADEATAQNEKIEEAATQNQEN